MATINGIELRLRFLKESAHLLVISSPTTSAILGAERDKLLQTQEADLQASKKEWDTHRRELCGACGNLMLPGWSCEVTKESHTSKPKKREKTEKNEAGPEKSMVYSCRRCHRKTVQPLQSRPPKHMRKASALPKSTDPVSAIKDSSFQDDKTKVTKAANASSKQRAKARKGGLQAMLAKSKTQSSGGQPEGLGLDLMDFMH
ncbi:hypothetical protein K469DRAFT_683155 [Zopfia rhizophila CBS 207.26]|uniref:Rpr2-domain-containing protein n=1 Tax=Zopfia rhizophila CBS 207.26 TaxID=1314779 RepID=A0A6A6ED28_9PEZI|nr:hypothetical protein K469DRAFT_683155 [Zopfia rhizophila CBS 207.26]